MNHIESTFGPQLSRAFFCLVLASTTANVTAADLDFDRTFSAKGESRQMHYRASYLLEGQTHRIEVWRDRDQRLKRRTDDAVETFVFKSARQAEWDMVVLDLKRKIRTDIDRTNLYRIGHFTGWFSLAHSLTQPVAPYRLTVAAKPSASEQPVAPCRWYALNRNGAESKICWSNTLHLPLLVTGKDDQVQWRVTAFDSQPITPLVFRIEDHGFVRNNANDDIKAD